MHRERRTLTTLTARDLTDPGPVPIRVLDSGLLMGGTIPAAKPSCRPTSRLQRLVGGTAALRFVPLIQAFWRAARLWIGSFATDWGSSAAGL